MRILQENARFKKVTSEKVHGHTREATCIHTRLCALQRNPMKYPG